MSAIQIVYFDSKKFFKHSVLVSSCFQKPPDCKLWVRSLKFLLFPPLLVHKAVSIESPAQGSLCSGARLVKYGSDGQWEDGVIKDCWGVGINSPYILFM